MVVRSFLFLLWFVLAAPLWADPAGAEIVHLRSDACYATAPSTLPVDARTVSALRFACGKPPAYARYRDGWVWLKVRDVRRLSALPPQWHLMTDQVRFDRMVAMIVARDGRTQIVGIAPGAIGRHWSLGGTMRVTVDRPGSDVRAVYVGYHRLDDLSLMRKLSAASPMSALWLDGIWLGLMGVFAGAILSAFAYNLLIYTGQRLAFQRWYLVWSGLTLAYGLSWTNLLAYAIPDFAGPWAVSVDYLLVAGLIAAGNIFFLTVIEEGTLPRRLVRAGWICATLNIIMGLVTFADCVATPLLVDRLLNLAFMASVLCVGTGVVVAIRARSRVVWFYLVGWTPVLCVFALRVARNFGLMVQVDAIDMSTFAALAFEAVALSLAIADRFRLLGKERDAADHARKLSEMESETFRRAAQTDFLTGLGNRAAFQARLKEMADGRAFTLLLIDVDHLKGINDRLGHDGGDRLLERVGMGLAMAGGEAAHVSRIGGDEFAMLLPEGEGECAGVRQALEALQGTTLTHAGRSWALSLSIGLARFPEDADSIEVLVKNADLALYHAKRHGRRRLHCYDPSLRARMDSRHIFSQEAHQGIERGEFSLYFQPIVDLPSGQSGVYEALLRWRHPTHGLMTPAIFADMLNEQKVGLAVQHHVLDLALTALRDYPHLLPKLSVNFTTAQLDGPHAASRLLARMRDFGVAPERLCIEVTEDVVLDRAISETASALGLLHDAGVSVALDDFGTGYASLIHLKQLPFDILKIDRSFTLSLFEDDGQSEEIIRAIIGLGQGLRKKVVAEGVETEAQRQRLAEMGCQFGQGYLFARPQPIEAMIAGSAASFAA